MQSDILILGAGLAGAHAAEKLAQAGHSAVIVDAANRVGGRGYTRGFGGLAPALEFGGSWITPWHRRMQEACRRHGIDLLPTTPVSDRFWHDGTSLRRDAPVGAADRAAYDRVIAQVVEDAGRLKEGFDQDRAGAPLLSLTMADYFRRLGVPESARAQLMAWWTISGSGDPATISAGELLASCGYIDGTPEGMMQALTHTLSPGVSTLVDRMITASGARLQLGFPVAHVRSEADRVTVTTRDGRSLQARAAIVAVPVNVLRDIDFGDGLTAPQQQAADRGHDGRAVKLWLRVKGVRQGTLATGGLSGLQWLFAPYSAQDDAILVVGFGLDDGSWNPHRRQDVAAALAHLLPQAELLGWDWHDWCADPFARGTWLSTPATGADLSPENWGVTGRLAFATSDLAPEAAGWFEGAMSSGEPAAAAIAAKL
ncbi:NAD(P)/FAD-dependent oxidoreductase [Dongia mobilis]|uniref:flavin monoamine oxidase family protein n=1 Tax=Dongia sp. TaxID=1977262 RepID=UPI0026F0084D